MSACRAEVPCRSVLCCRAGSDVTRAKSLGASTACTAGCHNTPTGDCGGTLATTVYVVGNNRPAPAPAANKGYTSVGCYADNIADRALPVLLLTDVGMTVDKCAGLAHAAGESTLLDTCLTERCFLASFRGNSSPTPQWASAWWPSKVAAVAALTD